MGEFLMTTFAVQTIEMKVSFEKAFIYIADPENLPKWTQAFRSVSAGKALLKTPIGAVDIKLVVDASREQGTIDWIMTFPDGSIARAHSRLIEVGEDRCLYSFVLLAPPVSREELEGVLDQQSRILREELSRLDLILAGTLQGTHEGSNSKSVS
jgi:hypothetical protein